MKYIKGEKVLPEYLLKAVQRYIDGACVYIPRKNEERRAWGENSGYRSSLAERNRRIYQRFLEGAGIEELTNEFYLSEQSIKRIIYCQKKKSA